MKIAVSPVLIAALYVLHHDFWFWRQARPFVFGVLPIGLAYHAAYTLATSLVLIVLVKLLWPAALDTESPPAE